MAEGLIARLACRFSAPDVTGPCYKLAGVIITEATLITLSVTRADIFAHIEASTGIKFSFGLISKLLNIRNLIWTQTKTNP